MAEEYVEVTDDLGTRMVPKSAVAYSQGPEEQVMITDDLGTRQIARSSLAYSDAREATPEEIAAVQRRRALAERHGDPLSQAALFSKEYLSSGTFGASDALFRSIAGDQYDTVFGEAAEVNPGVATAGELTGAFAGPIDLLTGGVGGKVLGATKLGSKLAKGGLLSRSLLSGAGNAIEGGAFGAGNAIREAINGKADLTAERLLQQVGLGALFGGAVGSAAPAIGQAITRKIDDLTLSSARAATGLSTLSREGAESLADAGVIAAGRRTSDVAAAAGGKVPEPDSGAGLTIGLTSLASGNIAGALAAPIASAAKRELSERTPSTIASIGTAIRRVDPEATAAAREIATVESREIADRVLRDVQEIRTPSGKPLIREDPDADLLVEANAALRALPEDAPSHVRESLTVLRDAATRAAQSEDPRAAGRTIGALLSGRLDAADPTEALALRELFPGRARAAEAVLRTDARVAAAAEQVVRGAGKAGTAAVGGAERASPERPGPAPERASSERPGPALERVRSFASLPPERKVAIVQSWAEPVATRFGPDVAAAFIGKTLAATEAIAAKIPAPMTPTVSIGKPRSERYDAVDVARAESFSRGAFSPIEVLEDLARGAVDRDALEGVKTAHPEEWANFRDKAIAAASTEDLSIDTTNLLGLIFDFPPDRAAQPEFASEYQKVWSQVAEAQAQAPAASGPDAADLAAKMSLPTP